MTSAVVLGMIVTMFPEPREQAKAIGVYAFVASAGGSIGLLAGGVLTEAIEPAAQDGWGAGSTLGLFAVALALLVAFVAFVIREATARTPLMPLRIFRSRNVSGANAIQALVVAGMFATFFLGALYLELLGYGPLQIGLAFLPTTIVMGTLSLKYSETLITRFGARQTLIPGLALVMAGLLLFTQAPVDGEYVVHVLPMALLLGTGVALAFPSLMTLAMSGATQEDAGLASGLVNTTAQVGGALGLAVLATVAATETSAAREAGSSAATALVEGYQLAYLVGAALVGLGILIALFVIQSERKAAAQAMRNASFAGLASAPGSSETTRTRSSGRVCSCSAAASSSCRRRRRRGCVDPCAHVVVFRFRWSDTPAGRRR